MYAYNIEKRLIRPINVEIHFHLSYNWYEPSVNAIGVKIENRTYHAPIDPHNHPHLFDFLQEATSEHIHFAHQ